MGARPASIARNKQSTHPQEQLFDTHPEVSLDFETVRQAARRNYARPFLILDTAIVREKARRFHAAMPRVRPHYAVKANPDPRVLKVLIEEGASFEIASIAELDLLLSLGVPAAEVFYSNPVKSSDSIAYAAGKGVAESEDPRIGPAPADDPGQQGACKAHQRHGRGKGKLYPIDIPVVHTLLPLEMPMPLLVEQEFNHPPHLPGWR